LGIKFLETSAQSASKVDESFFTLAEEIKQRVSKSDDSNTNTNKPQGQ